MYEEYEECTVMNYIESLNNKNIEFELIDSCSEQYESNHDFYHSDINETENKDINCEDYSKKPGNITSISVEKELENKKTKDNTEEKTEENKSETKKIILTIIGHVRGPDDFKFMEIFSKIKNDDLEIEEFKKNKKINQLLLKMIKKENNNNNLLNKKTAKNNNREEPIDKTKYSIRIGKIIKKIRTSLLQSIKNIVDEILKLKNSKCLLKKIKYNIIEQLFSKTVNFRQSLLLKIEEIFSKDVSIENNKDNVEYNKKIIKEIKEKDEELNRFFNMNLILFLEAIILKKPIFKNKEYNDILEKYYIDKLIAQMYYKLQKTKNEDVEEEEEEEEGEDEEEEIEKEKENKKEKKKMNFM